MKKITKSCLYCNSNMLSNGKYNKHYCSKKCRQLDYYNKNKNKMSSKYKAKYIKRIPITLNCKNCGKEFLSKAKHIIYCSKECCKKFNKDKINKIINGDIPNDRNAKTFAFLKTRFEIFKRDNFTCQYCGRNVKEDKIKLHIEHIIPKAKGGKDNVNNLTTSCTECNYGKKDILLDSRLYKNGEIL